MNASRVAIRTFRETMLDSDPLAARADRLDYEHWNSYSGRFNRFRLNMLLYQNSVYSDILNLAAPLYRSTYGLDRHVRNIYNPAYRLGEFWTSRLQGGRLDLNAGDGDAENSALPILAKSEAVRKPIARVWRDSRWHVAKEIYCRWGSVLGSVACRVVDDTASGKVYLENIHPGHLVWVDADPWWNIREGYDLERPERDPRPSSSGEPRVDLVTYREEVRLDGKNVVYRTFLDGVLYPWNGVASAWEEPYGFVPMILAHHQPVGGNSWGENCWHCGLSRFREVDDVASKFTDHVRKATHAPMLISGMAQPSKPLKAEPDDRESLKFIWNPSVNATATHLTFGMDYQGTYIHIRSLLDDIEKNFPELAADTGSMSGTITAEAIAMSRDRATDKVQSRRSGYDEPHVRALQMAIAIGGYRGYPDFAGFNLDSFGGEELEFSIGPRPVFGTDPLDEYAEKLAFWQMIQAQLNVGIPLEIALENNGWQKADIARLKAARAAQPQPAPQPADNPPLGAGA